MPQAMPVPRTRHRHTAARTGPLLLLGRSAARALTLVSRQASSARDGPAGLLFHSLVFLHALHLQTSSLNSSFNSFSAFFSRVWTVLLGIRSSSAVSRKVQSKK